MVQRFLKEMDGLPSDVHSMMTHTDQQQSVLEKMYFVASPVKLRETLTELLWTGKD
jgi:hypothetical protein